MKGRTIAIGFLVVLIGFTLLVFWIGASGGGTARLPPQSSVVAEPTTSRPPAPDQRRLDGGDGGPEAR